MFNRAGNTWAGIACPVTGRGIGQLKKFIFTTFLVLLLAGLSVWGGLALWFRLPLPEVARMIAGSGFALLGLSTIAAQFGKHQTRSLAIYAFAFTVVFIWWASIKPPVDGNWSPEVARQVTGVIDGDILTLTNMREFEWRSEDAKSEIWTTKTYDLSTIRSTDMFMSYWAGPEMAHMIMSFGFEDGEYLAWSVEVRRQVAHKFSPIEDFFKTNTLAIVASTEQDVIGVRSNVRGQDVRLFRLNTPPNLARHLIEEFVRDANALAQQPEFFNSLTTNCTTTVAKMLKAIDINVPFDWRLIANGYLPDMIYEHGALDTRVPLAQLRELGAIAPRAKAAGLTDGFSAAIRQGVPVPAQ